MKRSNIFNNGIPISISLNPTLEKEDFQPRSSENKKRIFTISCLAIAVAVFTSVIARLLIYLINLITNLSFHGIFSFHNTAPGPNSLGLIVIIVPAIGGVIVGFMALYGSKAIRGHGIPEAMEQILTNQSKIHPSITYLKPLSSAIAIGTGGPFGAEGPIIATGGALGSTIGQLLRITHNERKILLAAGATAGMSAIFGTPIAGIFLAIELLLFEFSPRSIIPVALACITGAAGHHLLFDTGPVFPMPEIESPGNMAVAIYSIMGLLLGIISAMVTKAVYIIEDAFEKLPVHWMWWPAIGGLAVGIIGYFAPRTLGVGYNNITDVLSGSLPMKVILFLCVLKFISWAIALGSGTSGGTLAPLLTIGGAAGALMGIAILTMFPNAGITLPVAALVGMSAMFAGASRALLTSIVFALESTLQSHALLPLLGACTGSYFISFFLMENTIMTEKIARRGIKTPHSYEPDMLEKVSVGQVIGNDGLVISSDNTIAEVRDWFAKEKDYDSNYLVIVNSDASFTGIITSSNLYNSHHNDTQKIVSLIKRKPISISVDSSLRTAVEIMANENVDVLPVVSEDKKTVVGILSYKDVLSAYTLHADEHQESHPHISLKRQRIKILLQGQRLINLIKSKG